MTTTTQNFTIDKVAAADRGKTRIGWLDSRHTFSFGDYFDPDRMGFRSLRVINDDRVEPRQGFGTHPHRDTEIFSYVIEGALEHRDSLGNGSVIRAGNLQYMSAGSGVYHSEFNPSDTTPVHFLQIWIRPRERGGEPRYAEHNLGEVPVNSLKLLLSGDGRDGSVELRQDADVYFGKLDAGRQVSVELTPGRGAWIHVIRGQVNAAGSTLEPGDGAGINGAGTLAIEASEKAEFLVLMVA